MAQSWIQMKHVLLLKMPVYLKQEMLIIIWYFVSKIKIQRIKKEKLKRDYCFLRESGYSSQHPLQGAQRPSVTPGPGNRMSVHGAQRHTCIHVIKDKF